MIKFIFPAMVIVLLALFFFAKKMKPKMDALKRAEMDYVDAISKFKENKIEKNALVEMAEKLVQTKGLPKEEALDMVETDLKVQGLI